MVHSILLFGQARELLGISELSFSSRAKTVADLRRQLLQDYPKLSQIQQLQIAVNQTYVEDDKELQGGEEIALLPPVSGG